MAGNRGKVDRQGGLFNGRSLNPGPEMKRALALAARASGLSRAEIVDQINALMRLEGLRSRGKGGWITLDIFNKWLAPEAVNYLPPTPLLPVVCKVLGSLGPMQALAGPAGGQVIGRVDQVLLEMARAQMAEKEAGRRKRRLAEQYEEMRK